MLSLFNQRNAEMQSVSKKSPVAWLSGGADSSVFFVSAQWCTLYQTEVADPVFAASVLSYGKISGEAEKSENSENLDASSMSGNYHIYLSEEG